MSRTNLETVRIAYESFARRDLDAIDALMRDHVAPDAEFESALTGQTYKGTEGPHDLATDLWETLDYFPEIEDLIDLGERVVAVLRISGQGTSSGVPVSQQVAIVWTSRRGRSSGESRSHRAPKLSKPGGCRSRAVTSASVIGPILLHRLMPRT